MEGRQRAELVQARPRCSQCSRRKLAEGIKDNVGVARHMQKWRLGFKLRFRASRLESFSQNRNERTGIGTHLEHAVHAIEQYHLVDALCVTSLYHEIDGVLRRESLVGCRGWFCLFL